MKRITRANKLSISYFVKRTLHKPIKFILTLINNGYLKIAKASPTQNTNRTAKFTYLLIFRATKWSINF